MCVWLFILGTGMVEVSVWKPWKYFFHVKSTEETSTTVENFNCERRFFSEFLRKNFFREIARKKVLSQLKITIAEQGSSMPSCRRSSSGGSSGRTIFRAKDTKQLSPAEEAHVHAEEGLSSPLRNKQPTNVV